ncbi:hypothetical protein ACWDUM_10135 [Rhodococcus sp. NPDC003322]
MDFDSTADELYGVEPSEFVAARGAAVASAKAEGDKALAKELAGLRKPTTTGWALNLLVRDHPEDVARLLDLGSTLRAAQQALRGEELRSLTAQRAAVLSALTDRAAAAARERGRELTETVLREVGQSLSAALADPEIGADLRSGRMLGAVSYSGFGPALIAAVPTPTEPTTAETEPEPAPRPAKHTTKADDRPTRDEARDAERREALEAARSAAIDRVAQDEEAAREANSELEAAAERAKAANRKVQELREELSRAEHESRFADSTLRTAEKAARHADTQLTRARESAAEFDS